MDPDDVARRALARYERAEGRFRLKLLDEDLLIYPVEERVSGTGREPGFHHWLVSVVYLTTAGEGKTAGRWVRPSSLPYGEFFFRGPHELPTRKLEDTFGSDAALFARACRRIGGEPAMGNGFVLPALPKVPVFVQLWEEDEEFPARAGFLFDAATCEHLPIDAVFSLSIIIADRLITAADG